MVGSFLCSSSNLDFKQVTVVKNGDGTNPFVIVIIPVPDGYSKDFPIIQNASTGALFIYDITYVEATNSMRIALYQLNGTPVASTTRVTITVAFRKNMNLT